MATLADIGKKVGVSESLVSKVLNGRMGTSGARQDLVELIQRTAKEMGHQKNSSALALSRSRQNVIGLFLHSFGRPGCGIMDSLQRGISVEALKWNQRLIQDYFVETEEFIALKGFANKANMDGLLIGGLPHEELMDDLLALQASGMPLVTLFDKQVAPSLPNVSFDPVEMGSMATNHLIEQGCRKIAHIVDFEDRFDGYCKALAGQDLPLDDRLVYREVTTSETPVEWWRELDENPDLLKTAPLFSYGRGCRAVEFLLASNVAFDGVVAQSDEEGLGVMNTLMEHRIRIPQEVRVIGMDNAPYCNFSRTPLSSVSQSGFSRGRIAFDMLMNLIEGKSVESVTIQPELFARESSVA